MIDLAEKVMLSVGGYLTVKGLNNTKDFLDFYYSL